MFLAISFAFDLLVWQEFTRNRKGKAVAATATATAKCRRSMKSENKWCRARAHTHTQADSCLSAGSHDCCENLTQNVNCLGFLRWQQWTTYRMPSSICPNVSQPAVCLPFFVYVYVFFSVDGSKQIWFINNMWWPSGGRWSVGLSVRRLPMIKESASGVILFFCFCFFDRLACQSICWRSVFFFIIRLSSVKCCSQVRMSNVRIKNCK